MMIERVTSPAAIDAWLVEDHTLPVVALRFAFPGGAALDPAGKSGLAAMAVSLLDEGAGPYDTAAFKTRLDDLVIGLRFEAGRDEIVGSLRTLKANLGQAVELLRLALAAPRFEASAIERVRGEFVASLSQEAQNPRALSGRLWMRDAFEDQRDVARQCAIHIADKPQREVIVIRLNPARARQAAAQHGKRLGDLRRDFKRGEQAGHFWILWS